MALGRVRIGPRMTLSHPMIVVSRATGGLPGGMVEDLTVVAGDRLDFCPRAEVALSFAGVTAAFGEGSITGGVDEAAAAASESACDLGPA